jgi:hypothetical protein
MQNQTKTNADYKQEFAAAVTKGMTQLVAAQSVLKDLRAASADETELRAQLIERGMPANLNLDKFCAASTFEEMLECIAPTIAGHDN